MGKATKSKIQKIGRYSAESVKKHTGKDWDQWLKLMKSAGADNWSHKEIVNLLAQKYKLTLWWRQVVASGFEQHLGKKIEGVNAKGLYSFAASKTFPISQKKLWNWLVSPDGLAVWLKPMSNLEIAKGQFFEVEGGIYGEIRTLFAPDRIRIKWKDEDYEKASYLHIGVIARSAEKSVFYFTHDDIPNARMKIQLRERWKTALETSFQEVKKLYCP